MLLEAKREKEKSEWSGNQSTLQPIAGFDNIAL